MKKLFSRDKPKNVKSPPQSRDLASPGFTAPYTPQEVSRLAWPMQSIEPSLIHPRATRTIPNSDPSTAPPFASPLTSTGISSRMMVCCLSRPLFCSTSLIAALTGGSPLLGTQSPRAVSPFGGAPLPPPKAPSSNGRSGDREPGVHKHKAPGAAAAVGILRALDPHLDTPVPTPRVFVDRSDQYSFDSAHREERERKKGFWERASDRSKDKDREKEKLRERERRDEEGQAELTRMIGASRSSRHAPDLADVHIQAI